MTPLIPFLTAALDRMRGSESPSLLRAAGTLVYGALLVWLLTGHNGWGALAGGVLWWLGEKPSWGDPLGDVLYRAASWKNIVKLAGRGFVWGAPMLLLTPWLPQLGFLPFFMLVVMPVSALAARAVRKRLDLPYWITAWEFSEAFRGGLVAALAAAVGATM